jgi:hypothetical protein
MEDDLYVWQAPRELDADAAEALVAAWEAEGGDPARSPFEPSTDIGWFVRELRTDGAALEIVTDAPPSSSTRPVWLSANDQEPAARVVVLRPRPDTTSADLGNVISLAAKYDLVVYDRRNGGVHRPLAEMADLASATFWPRGAIQAFVAGSVGVVLAVAGLLVPIPIVNVVLVVIGGFLALGAVYTFVHEGRKRLRSARSSGGPAGT